MRVRVVREHDHATVGGTEHRQWNDKRFRDEIFQELITPRALPRHSVCTARVPTP